MYADYEVIGYEENRCTCWCMFVTCGVILVQQCLRSHARGCGSEICLVPVVKPRSHQPVHLLCSCDFS